MNKMETFRQMIAEQLDQLEFNQTPENLYDPIRYILSLGGKRIRPALMLVSHELFGGDPKNVVGPAMAVEMFHNFTLLHDDLMDNANLRRGKPSVHSKWNENIAILSGDALCVLSYDQLLKADPQYLAELIRRFNRTAVEICEGQQMDLNFESSAQVTLPEYKEMIRLKTAVLLGYSLWAGAFLAGASKSEQDLCYQIGEDMGLGFQLKDDYLDAFGDPSLTGKEVGGDIKSDKKTYLQIEANRLGHQHEKGDDFVSKTIDAYVSMGLDKALQNEVQSYAKRAVDGLKNLGKSHENLTILERIIEQLSERDH